MEPGWKSNHQATPNQQVFDRLSSQAQPPVLRCRPATKCWQATMLEDQTFQGQIVRLGLVQNRLTVNGRDQNQIWNKVSTPEHLLAER